MSEREVPLYRKIQYREAVKSTSKGGGEGAVKISFTSGKGGVGKTSMAVKMSTLLAGGGKRVLLVDCDYNLSNGVLKLGLPINDYFYELVASGKPFKECLYKDGNLHILSGCSGHLDIFEGGIPYGKILMDILRVHEHEYDVVVLDCAAGLGKAMASLSAYCDHRFIIVTPDKSSITDSYSLIKILRKKYGVVNNHLLVNKVSSVEQYTRVVKTLSETVGRFLDGRLNILGSIRYDTENVERFDRRLLKDADSKLHRDISKITKRFVEEHFVSPQFLRG